MQAYPQDITNTLGSGGVFKIKDAVSDYFTVTYSTGQVNILKSLRLENTSNSTTGVIYTAGDRFIHNYGTNNTFIGINSGNFSMSGNSNTALGIHSLFKNTTGSNNTAFGLDALYNNTTGSDNTACGWQSLFSNTAGINNTAYGTESLLSNTTGNNNTATGFASLRQNTTGSGNTANGFGSLANSTTASRNTADGYQSLGYNSTGSSNTANGYQSLFFNTTGSNNTASGDWSLYTHTTGSNNTALGVNAYPVPTTLNNYTGVGYNVGFNSSTSNSVEIGNTSVSSIRGQVNFSIYSDERIKDNISENVPGLAFINKLRPVTYNLNIHKQNEIVYKGKENQAEWDSKYDIEKIRMTGFIAQEVEKAAIETNYNFSGVEKSKDETGLYSLRYSEFVVPLVKAVQEQQATIKNQQEEIREQKSQIQNQGRIIEVLTKRIEQLEKK